MVEEEEQLEYETGQLEEEGRESKGGDREIWVEEI